jgi:hypothetical protein
MNTVEPRARTDQPVVDRLRQVVVSLGGPFRPDRLWGAAQAGAASWPGRSSARVIRCTG